MKQKFRPSKTQIQIPSNENKKAMRCRVGSHLLSLVSVTSPICFYLQPTIQDQARQLLDILPYRGPKAFTIFVDALKEDYEWLAEDLEEALTLKPDLSDEPDNELIDEKPVEEILKDLLNRGGVPSSPSHHIQRQCEMDAVKEGLANLDNGQFLAIHGMPGSGKSVLAAEVLRDPEITLKYFPDGVFWFRVGMLEPQKLLNRVKILLEKLNCGMVSSSFLFSYFSISR